MPSATGYPDKPIGIATSARAGSADFVARVLARELSLSLRQPVTVDNWANAVVPMPVIADARPDGYSLLVSGGALWIGPLFEEKPSRDVLRDFVPITLATSSPNILVVHPSLPVNSIQELIALAESRPRTLRYSSGSTGSSSYLAGEAFKLMTGINLVRAAYNESGAIDDLISGKVQLMFGTAGVVAPHLGSDKLRALAVTSARPSMLVPGLPTVAASGFPGFESATQIGLFAPAQTPAEIVEILSRESVRILRSPVIRNELLKTAMDTVGSSPQEFADTIKSEMARLENVIVRRSESNTAISLA